MVEEWFHHFLGYNFQILEANYLKVINLFIELPPPQKKIVCRFYFVFIKPFRLFFKAWTP